MKTLLIAFSLLAFASCEVCEECTTTTTSNTQSTPISVTNTEVCGRKEIKAMEGTTTSTSGSVTVKTVTNCR